MRRASWSPWEMGCKGKSVPLFITKQVRLFLGFGNFYRKFISHYSDIARPLKNSTKKDWKFEWTDNTQQLFDNLKKLFTEEPVLMMPDHNRPFQIKSNASKVATRAVLTQLDSNRNQHLVAFLSQTFTNTEKWYEIYNRELLGIIWALKEWRHYIHRSGHTTNVVSDHKNLMYFHIAQKLNDQEARWSLYLSEFDIFKNFSNSWISHHYYLQPIILRQTELQNK